MYKLKRLKNEFASIEALPIKHIDSFIEKHTLIAEITVLQETLYYYENYKHECNFNQFSDYEQNRCLQIYLESR